MYLTEKIFILLVIVFMDLPETMAQPASKIEPVRLPVTKKAFLDDSSKLQFAIISDVWGGRRPGIFEDAVEKLSLLQPQFVISVGDLIDGKSYDSIIIASQWDEFDAAIRPLAMPFFYVPGNHDLGNSVMEQQWIKRMGSPYYHFIYKNALFLSVNTEDGGHGGIREKQIAYFKKVIEENSQVRWTFLFMHRPVWQGKGDRQEGFEKIEAFLKGRNYTLFSGHHHTYLRLSKNGNKHFVLGSTGGGSDLRGEKFGEFDHVTLVTLTTGEPKVVNLKLEGIIKEDVVNEQTHPITESLIDQTWLRAVPFVSEHQWEKTLSTEIILTNPTNYPLKVSGRLGEESNYSIQPSSLELVVAPATTITRQLLITKKNAALIDLDSMSSVDITLTGEFMYSGTSYSLPAAKKMLLSWKFIPTIMGKENKSANGFYNGRDTTGMFNLTEPEYLNGPWYWSGPADGLLRFKMMEDGKYAYIIAMVNDDQWVNNAGVAKDLLYLHLEDANGKQHNFSYSPEDNKLAIEGKGTIDIKDISLKKYFRDGLLMVEFKIPFNKVLKNDNTIRINIGYRDQDERPEKWVSTMFWKPLWGSPGDYKNSGTFIFK